MGGASGETDTAGTEKKFGVNDRLETFWGEGANLAACIGSATMGTAWTGEYDGCAANRASCGNMFRGRDVGLEVESAVMICRVGCAGELGTMMLGTSSSGFGDKADKP